MDEIFTVDLTLLSNWPWRFFSIFVAFSENVNFMTLILSYKRTYRILGGSNLRCLSVPQAEEACDAYSQSAFCKSWGQAFEPERKNEIWYDKINTKQERKGFCSMTARSFTKSIWSNHLHFISIYQFNFINLILWFNFIDLILPNQFYQFYLKNSSSTL